MRDEEEKRDDLPISSLSVALVTHTRDAYELCDPVLNIVVGEIKTKLRLDNFCLIAERNLLVTSHYGNGFRLVMWSIETGLGVRIQLAAGDDGLVGAAIAVNHGSTIIISGPLVIDIESRLKIATLGCWRDGCQFEDVAVSFDDQYLIGFDGRAIHIWDMGNFTKLGTLTAVPTLRTWCMDIGMGICSHFCVHQSGT